jgi:hypothetical protein
MHPFTGDWSNTVSLVEDATEFVTEGYMKQASGACSVFMLFDWLWCQYSDAVFDGVDDCPTSVAYCVHQQHVSRWHAGAHRCKPDAVVPPR